jgi:type II secretory pathway pseudopilin PulG
LVEVLIVVVIIAILASLVMPRMLAKTGRAKAAEAIQMVGTFKRAAERGFDLTGSYPSGWFSSDFGYHGGDWGVLGLKELGDAKNWAYYYSGGDGYFDAYAYSPEGYYVEYYWDSAGPDWSGWYCDETVFTNGGDLSKPCTLA